MITELSRFYRGQDIDSVVLTKKWPDTLREHEKYEGIDIYRVISARTTEEFESIIDWVKENESKIKADIIHIVGVRRPLPVIALLLSAYWNVPLVSTISGSEIPNTGDSGTAAEWEQNKEITRPVIEQSSVVTCVSKALERDLKKILNGITDIRTIYAGIDIDFINHIPHPETTEKYIISLRRLIPSKGIDILIKAFKEISYEYPDITLIIAGEGSEFERLKDIVKINNLKDRVRFIGTISLEKAVSLLKGALCTVVPSLSEGGSLVNVEAQAASCPVIASNVGGIPEYINPGISGLLFKPGDYKDLAEKLRLLLSNKDLRGKLIEGGHIHSKKFSWNILGPQYLAIYEEMIRVSNNHSFKPWSDLTQNLWLKLVNKT